MLKSKYKNFLPLAKYDKKTILTLKNIQLIILFQIIICGFLLPDYLSAYKGDSSEKSAKDHVIAHENENKEINSKSKLKEEAYNFNKEIFEVILNLEKSSIKAVSINNGNADIKLSSNVNISNFISKVEKSTRLKIVDVEFQEASQDIISLVITRR